eukprot:3764045-Pyramimonas_sp.AAC.1
MLRAFGGTLGASRGLSGSLLEAAWKPPWAFRGPCGTSRVPRSLLGPPLGHPVTYWRPLMPPGASSGLLGQPGACWSLVRHPEQDP